MKTTIKLKTKLPTKVDIGLNYAKKYNVKLANNHAIDSIKVPLLTDEHLEVGISFLKKFSSFLKD